MSGQSRTDPRIVRQLVTLAVFEGLVFAGLALAFVATGEMRWVYAIVVVALAFAPFFFRILAAARAEGTDGDAT